MEYTITRISPDKLDEKLAQFKKLSAQRDQISERLEKVEAKKDSVASRIYEKVKAEYGGKLELLQDQLTPIVVELEEARKNFVEELSRLKEDIRVAEEELAEGEFRFRVGEFSQTKFTSIQTRVDPDLTEWSERQAVVTELLEAINQDGPGSTQPDSNVSEPEEEIEDRETETTDTGDSTRVTLPDDDPLQALTDEPAGETTESSADSSADASVDAPVDAPVDSHVDSHADASVDAPVDSHADASVVAPVDSSVDAPVDSPPDASFENPQDWLGELGEGKEQMTDEKDSGNLVSEESDDAADSGVALDDDPLAALADPTGDQIKTKAPETTEPEPEAVCMGFPNLVMITGPSSGRKIPLLPMTMSIGREHDNNIELKDPDVGRYHARILYENGRFLLEDLESSNGTWVNGERITSTTLKNGDRVKIGEIEMAIDFD